MLPMNDCSFSVSGRPFLLSPENGYFNKRAAVVFVGCLAGGNLQYVERYTHC